MANDADLDSALSRLTRDYWAKNHAPLLLSSLPAKLLNEVPQFRDILGARTLKAFTKDAQARAASYKLIEHPSMKAKLGLIPPGEAFEYKDSEPGDSDAAHSPTKNSENLINFVRILSRLPAAELDKISIPATALVELLK